MSTRQAKLGKRELQVMEYVAWGASQKEIANTLGISSRTVDNTVRKIKIKLGLQKMTELSAYWFCTHFNISFELSPLKRAIGAVALVALIVFNDFISEDTYCCCRRARRVRTEVSVRLKEAA